MSDRKDPRVAKKDHDWSGSPVIKVEVGRGRRIFYIHVQLLRYRSALFLREGFAMDIFKLPHENPSTFDTYLRYAYTGELPCKGEKVTMKDQSDQISDLLDLYFLAHKLEDCEAMDAVISGLLAIATEPTMYFKCGSIPTDMDISRVYASTKPDSKLRRLVVDLYALEGDPDLLESIEAVPAEFLVDLSKALMKKYAPEGGLEKTLETVSCCDYHQHGKDAMCPNKKRKREEADGEEPSATAKKSKSSSSSPQSGAPAPNGNISNGDPK